MAPTLGHVGFAVWVFLIFFLSLSCGKTNLDGREQVVEIDVKPGGVVHTYEENLVSKYFESYCCPGQWQSVP